MAPGGQLIKGPPKDAPKAAPRSDLPLKIRTQETMDKKSAPKPSVGEPPAKATRIEVPKSQPVKPAEPEKESEVEEFEVAESEPEPAGFSMKNELKKLKKEKDEKKAKALAEKDGNNFALKTLFKIYCI